MNATSPDARHGERPLRRSLYSGRGLANAVMTEGASAADDRRVSCEAVTTTVEVAGEDVTLERLTRHRTRPASISRGVYAYGNHQERGR